MTRTRTAGPSAGGGMTGPQLPAFYMPIGETGVSAWLPAAERELWPWLSARGLAPGEHVRGHIRRTNPALLSARFYPAAGCGILPLLAQFCAWAFIVDDEFDEGACGRDSALSGRAVAGLLAVLEHGAAAGASPPMAALADLWGRLTARRSPGWCRQFADNIRSWLITYHQGALQHESGYAPGIEEFCRYRQLAVGMHMFLDLAEVVADIDLPDEVRYCPSVMDLRRAVAEHVAFIPDRWAVQPQPALPRGAFVPFGDGPRKCIGDTIGMTMATLALASIAARWRLEISAGARVRPVLRTFLAPRGLRATVRAR